jgi:hypothetical protein
MNYILLSRASHICRGEYMTDEELKKYEYFLPREEGSFLSGMLIFYWILILLLLLVIL